MANRLMLFVIATVNPFLLAGPTLGKTVSVNIVAVGCYNYCKVERHCGGIKGCCKSSVKINGCEYLKSQEGITFIVLDPNTGDMTGMLHLQNFKKKEERRRVTQFFDKQLAGSIVIIFNLRTCKGRVQGWLKHLKGYLAGQSDEHEHKPLDNIAIVSCIKKCSSEIEKQKAIPMFKTKSDQDASLNISVQFELPGDVSMLFTKAPVMSECKNFYTIQPKPTKIPSTVSMNPTPTNITDESTPYLKTNDGESDDSKNKIGENKDGGSRNGFSKVTIAVIGIAVVLATVLIIMLIFIVRSKRRARRKNTALAGVEPCGIDEEGYCTIVSRDEPSRYEKMSFTELKDKPDSGKEGLLDDGEEYDSVPEPSPSILPATNFFKLTNGNMYLNRDHSENFAKYVKVTKDAPAYKVPSSIPKHNPPSSSPPPPETDLGMYVDLAEHLYEDPNTPHAGVYEDMSCAGRHSISL